MTFYSIESKDQVYVKCYGFFCYGKNINEIKIWLET